MINPQFLIAFALLTALLWIPAGLRLYKQAIPLHWLFAVAFILGSLGIAAFYLEIEYGLLFGLDRVVFSRWLWSIVLGVTSFLAVSILVYRR